MIDQLTGTITALKDRQLTLTVGGIGFALNTPQAQQLSIGTTTQLFTYMHWNADQGPSLYAFSRELERTVFLLIIDCPKIGPSIACNILSQVSAEQFIELISTHNEKGLSSLNGIGAKKAEQLVVELKQKVAKMLTSGSVKIDQQHNFVLWQQLSEVLLSLNYSKQEVSRVTQMLSEKFTGQNQPLDHLIRAALAQLSLKQS